MLNWIKRSIRISAVDTYRHLCFKSHREKYKNIFAVNGSYEN